MATIKIHTQTVKHLSTSLSKDISRLANVENEISSLNYQLDWKIKERGNLHQRIDRSSRSVKELEARVRTLENMIRQSMSRYEQAEDSLVREANRIGQIEMITSGEGNATNPFLKSFNSFKEIGQDIWSEMTNRNEKKFDSWYDFGNYLTLGVFDSVQAFYEGMQHRWRVATNSSYDFINYLSMGGFDTVKGTFNPEEAYSKEHWLNSMGVFGYFVGMGTLMKSWNSTRLGMNKGKDEKSVGEKGKIDDKGTGKGGSVVTSRTVISPDMEAKILEGQRKVPKNELIGGHSQNINNANDNFAVEVLSTNADGTKNVLFTKQFPDGSISKLKKSTLFPDLWSNDQILNSIIDVGNTPAISTRLRDGATWHRTVVNGVEIDVLKVGNDVTSGYPTGTVNAPRPSGF